jgi:hypothetical protein
LIAVGAIRVVARQGARTKVAITLAGVVGILLMALAIVGSVYPWPDAPFDKLPPIFGIYMGIGIAWMIYDRRRTRATSGGSGTK